MPLRALTSGRDLIAPLLDDAEWEGLRAEVKAKRAVVSLPCCDASAFPRVSKLGTRHFVHRRAEGCAGSGETFQHLWLKAEILAACRSAGWEARTEVAGEGWRADVLATRDSARVAFEVQWSRQDDLTTQFRQDRYAADGIRACWLYRGECPTPATRDLPVFRLQPEDVQVATVGLGGCRYGIREFTALLLGGSVHFSPSLSARLRVSFIEMDCWRCHRLAHVFYAEQSGRCGHEISYVFERSRRNTVDAFDPQILTLVQRWLGDAGRGAGIKLGAIKERHSKLAEATYLSFGCPHCDALFGEWFVREAVMEALLYDQTVASFETDMAWVAVELEGRQGHWCLPEDGISYCDQTASDRVRLPERVASLR